MRWTHSGTSQSNIGFRRSKTNGKFPVISFYTTPEFLSAKTPKQNKLAIDASQSSGMRLCCWSGSRNIGGTITIGGTIISICF